MIYFIRLSQGEYDDYNITYYFGNREITQQELTDKQNELKHQTIDYGETLERKGDGSGYKWRVKPVELREDEWDDRWYPSEHYNELMSNWLKSLGYKEIPDCPQVHEPSFNL